MKTNFLKILNIIITILFTLLPLPLIIYLLYYSFKNTNVIAICFAITAALIWLALFIDRLIKIYNSLKSKYLIFYNIVPKNDGYHYLCADGDNIYLAHKSEPRDKNELVFLSKKSANRYIKLLPDRDKYKVEELLRRR